MAVVPAANRRIIGIMAVRPVSIFLSSTCYELADLRYELADALRRDAFIVKMSEDPSSAFYVDPLDDSIASCLANVEASDVVVCILDRRYGGVLKDGANAGLSATHVEIRHARANGKPVFYFIREAAARDFEALTANSAHPSKWVEPHKEDARKKWLALVTEVSTLPKHAKWSNWYDSFKTVVDLKPLVRKRLADQFPEQLGAVALHPERVLRVVFVRGAPSSTEVQGHFRNVGPGPAFNVQHGSRVGAKEISRAHRGGLADPEDLKERGDQDCKYPAPTYAEGEKEERALFCEYENRFGDVYRVEVPLLCPNPRASWQFQAERFYVRAGDGAWIDVSGPRR